MFGSDGRSVKGVEFRFRHAGSRGSRTSSLIGLQVPDEAYLVEIPSESRASYFEEATESDEFQLIVELANQGAKTVDLVPGQMELTIALTTPAELEVTILGYQGSGFEGRLEVDANPIESHSPSYSFGGRGSNVTSSGVQTSSGLVASDPGRNPAAGTVASSYTGRC